MKKKYIVDKIGADWGHNYVQSNICLDILDYLVKNADRNIKHITHSRLRDIVGQEYSDIDLLKAVQYLCGQSVHLLEIKFEFIDNEYIHQLSKSEVKSAQENGGLVHPATGEYLMDFEDKIFIYFEPSKLIQDIDS